MVVINSACRYWIFLGFKIVCDKLASRIVWTIRMPEALLWLPAQTCKGLTDSVFLKIATGIDDIILEIAARKGGGKIWRI